ncbi:MAG: response regulator [Saprospiraceae bacterium]|nr:response regulator [Saprospiraceae bacterium]
MQKKILVIEDNTEVRENLVEILSLSDYDVLAAPEGKTGVSLATEHLPDLVLCDVMMPELDGFGVLRILSKNPATMDIPFIFLTAKAEKTDFRKGMGLGADDYITKPFDDVELLDAIEVRLKKRERMVEAFDGTSQGLHHFFSEAKAQKELDKLSEDREERKFAKRSIIFEEGQRANWLYFIVDGKVKCYKTSEYGKELITHIYGSGEFFGYIPLITDSIYTESASALEDVTLLLIPKDDFNLLLYQNKDFGLQFIKMLANQVHEIEEHLVNLAYDSVRKKVAKALQALFDKYQEGTQARFSILREDLASLAGTAKETVIRTLSDFKDENLIEIDGNDLIISNVDKLKHLRY